MQVMSSSLSLSPSFNKFSGTGFPDIAGEFSHDFGVKLQLETEEPNKEQEEESNNQPEEEEEEGNEEDEEEEEFSFVCLDPDGSPISADDVFQDGQIRAVFPLFNQDLLFANENGSLLKSEDGEVSLRPPLRKLFVEDSPDTSSSSEPVGPYCEWRRDGKTVEETSPDTCKKSNSTGFSKLWRFRDLMHRSSSDGKDAFVFLNHSPPASASSVKTEKKSEKEEKNVKVKVTGEKPKATKEKTASLSAHETLYIKNRAKKEGDKRRSYLPYKQVGFFTNVSGLSRNVHPF